MFFSIQSGSGTPIYLQIEAQIKHGVAAGALADGEALPPVRKLATDLQVNPNTVARAYSNLERDGLLRTVPGGGTYILSRGSVLLKAEKLRRLKPLAVQLAVEGKQMGVSAQEVAKLLEQAYRDLEGGVWSMQSKHESLKAL